MLEGSFVKAVLSKAASRSSGVSRRIDVRPVVIKKETQFQFTSRIENQDYHQNMNAVDASTHICELAGTNYRDLLIVTASEEVTARYSRKGECSIKRRSVAAPGDVVVAPPSHNRIRNYLIPDGQPVPFLIATGIMSKQGHVVAKHYKKFRQINRYVEFIKDVVDQLPAGIRLQIVDFGCGKSYLTFATHYLLTQTMNRNVSMVGLDRRTDVVDTCNRIVTDLNLQHIRFEAGDIADFTPEFKVNMAISLHACDTATDDAIAMAVQWQADAILAVPCCQHELASHLKPDRQPLFSEHGILHERFSSLATDAIRANLLECVGYSTKVMEFIDTEHTPKNLLIRGIRKIESLSDSPDRQYWRNLQTFSNQLGLLPLRLQKKLEEYGLLRMNGMQ